MGGWRSPSLLNIIDKMSQFHQQVMLTFGELDGGISNEGNLNMNRIVVLFGVTCYEFKYHFYVSRLQQLEMHKTLEI